MEAISPPRLSLTSLSAVRNWRVHFKGWPRAFKRQHSLSFLSHKVIKVFHRVKWERLVLLLVIVWIVFTCVTKYVHATYWFNGNKSAHVIVIYPKSLLFASVLTHLVHCVLRDNVEAAQEIVSVHEDDGNRPEWGDGEHPDEWVNPDGCTSDL